MAIDHPDGIRAISVSRSDIKAPVDIQKQIIGVYLKPDWEAKEGNDKNFYVTATNRGFNESNYLEYAVTAGKTLYLCGLRNSYHSPL